MTPFLFRNDPASLAGLGIGRQERLPYNVSLNYRVPKEMGRPGLPRASARERLFLPVRPRNFATPSIFPKRDRMQFARAPSRFPHSSRWPNPPRQIPPQHSQSPSRALALSPCPREFG